MTGSGRDEGREPPPDRLETWAKWTGRTLGFVALFLLALHLLNTYAPR
ncbi:MAG: hypothetical protein KDK07_09345 [Bauldia sp.]|nr:hypothetical protein [Bauldia sp.]